MSDADLHALWSAWLTDRKLHRGCILVSAIMRATVERAAMLPLYEVRVSDDGGLTARRVDDPTGTDPYLPQLKPPQADTRGERAPLPQGGIVHDYPPDAMPRGLRMAQDDWGRRTAYLDSGPQRPTNPEIDGDGA